jgi:sugar phosphate isomerase/epimerase
METSRLSVVATALAGDLRTALKRAREAGFRGVELDVRTGLDPELVTQTGLRQIRKWLEDEGLAVAAVSFRTRGGYADAERLEPRIAATKAALSLAHGLGAPVVLNHVGDVPPAAESGAAVDPRWRLLVEVLGDIGAWGERAGATLCAETGRVGPADMLRLIDALPDGSLTCDIVPGALVVHGHDPVAAIAALSGHVGHVHAADAVAGAFAGRGRAVILGTGQVDWPGVFGALEERGYHGWIGLDAIDRVGSAAELAAAVEFLRAL